MKKILNYLKPYWYLAIWAPLLMVGEVLVDLELPTIMASIVDDGILAGGGMDVIRPLGIRMMILVVLGGIFGVGAAFFASVAAQNFGNDLRRDAFARVMALSLEQTDRFTTGSLVTRMTNDITMIQQLVSTGLRMLFRAPVFFIGGIIMAIRLNIRFATVIAISIPFQFLLIFLIIRKVRPLFDTVQKKLDSVNAVVQENVAGARVVKAYTREEHECERFGEANRGLSGVMLSIQQMMAWMSPLMMLILNVAVIAIIVVGGIKISHIGGTQVGDIMAAINYITHILMSMMMMSMLFQNFTRAAASAKRVGEVLEASPVICGGTFEGDEVPEEERGHLVFDHVDFRYPSSPADAAPVLHDINLDIAPGSNIAILGATGAGKSSLVNLIARFYDPTAGKVTLDGRDIKEYTLTALRKRVSYVLQKSELFTGTVAENLRWGNPDADDGDLREAATVAQADAFISGFANGYDTVVAERGASLSGGQKQRLAIARALLQKPEVLIFDDSMSALDLATAAKLQQAMREKRQGITVITIAQRVASVMSADCILVLEGGTVAAAGTHEVLLRESPVYRDIYESQLKGGECLE